MKYFLIFISAIILFSCSTSKDRFLNRNYHAFITKFNVLYNSEVSFNKGVKEVEDTYIDDFTEILPIEPFSFYAEEKIDDNVKPIGQGNFEKAEQKAAKSIQKHSMLIDGDERNYQIDEAFLVLGKSRYYTKRFTPALESFEYIIKNYPRASLIYETVVWRAKANIHIGNYSFGKKSLQRLLGSPKIKGKTRQEAELAMVMAYEKTPDSITQIITHLEASLDAKDKGVMASRAAFLLGQLYRNNGNIQASDSAFNRVINTKKGLYKYKLQAKLEKINNHIDEYNSEQFLKELNKLIFIQKNRSFLSELFFQKGLVYEKVDSLKLAKKLYTKSIEKSKNVQGKIIAYEQLGNLFYNQKKYQVAKTYYDSLIDVSINSKSKRLIRIKRKSQSLEKIVTTINNVQINDSLLKMASMNNTELDVFFKNYVDQLKEKERLNRIKALKALDKQNRLTDDGNTNTWYFFNVKSRTEGKKTFQKDWNSPKKNNMWFVASRESVIRNEKGEDEGEEKTVSKDDEIDNRAKFTKYDVPYYTSQINRDPKFLDSISKLRNLNYYELGNSYYSQLSEKELAINKLKQLIEFNPSDDLKMGAYYRLYKINKESDDTEQSNLYRQKLIQEFPNSSFTKLINNQKNITTFEEEDYIKCYEIIYELYLLNSFEAAKEEITQAIQNYGESPFAAKYALLNAYLVAKSGNKKEFYKLLKEIKLRYPNTLQAQKADEILKK